MITDFQESKTDRNLLNPFYKSENETKMSIFDETLLLLQFNEDIEPILQQELEGIYL